jgi:hypothetical protein
MRRPIPFWVQSKEGRSKAVSAQKLINWYLEINKDDQEFPFVLYPTPGLVIRAIVGDGPIRGIHKMGDDLWVVSGDRLYRVPSSWIATDIGQVSGTGMVTMANNGTHVLIVTSGQDAYYANAAGIWTITEQNMVSATYQDGYGLAGKRTTEQFYHSDVDDMTTWGATAFSSADALADNLVALARFQHRIWVLGEKTIERWYNYGGSPFAFQREQGSVVEVGCAAPHSVAIGPDRMLWVGHDHRVYVTSGGIPEPVSNAAVSRVIDSDTSPVSAEAFIYTQEEHQFYVLSLLSSTLVFDLTTGLWSHRASRGLDRWRCRGYEWIWGKHVTGDYANGCLYELVMDNYSEPEVATHAITAYADATGGKVTVTSAGHGLVDGDEVYVSDSDHYDGNYKVSGCATNTFVIEAVWSGDDATGNWRKYVGTQRKAIGRLLSSGGYRVAMDELLLSMEMGVGLDGSVQGADPDVMLRYSDDGGNNWSNERWGKIGKLGEYERQIRFARLGQFRERLLEVSVSDPVKAVLRGAWADMQVLGK